MRTHLRLLSITALLILCLIIQDWALHAQQQPSKSPFPLPSPAEAEALIKEAARQRLAGNAYSEEERRSSLENLAQMKVRETVACYPALNRPDPYRICLLLAIGWQKEPYFTEQSMLYEKEGWRLLESTPKAACPTVDMARKNLPQLVANPDLEISLEESDRFGLFTKTRVDGTELEEPPRLRCKYRVHGDQRGRALFTYVGFDDQGYRFDSSWEFF